MPWTGTQRAAFEGAYSMLLTDLGLDNITLTEIGSLVSSLLWSVPSSGFSCSLRPESTFVSYKIL